MSISFSQFSFAAQDITAPILEDIKIISPVIKPGEKISVEITVSDDLSGVNQIVLNFTSPNKQLVTGSIIFDSPSTYGTFTLETRNTSIYAEEGKWNLSYIYISDAAGNYYSNTDSSIFVEVDENAPDSQEPVDDGFTAWEPKTDVPLNKEWTITFSLDFDINTILSNNIYITDATGQKIPLKIIIDRDSNLTSSTITVAPLDSYRSNTTYTLYIKDVQSKDGKVLEERVKMKFTTL